MLAAIHARIACTFLKRTDTWHALIGRCLDHMQIGLNGCLHCIIKRVTLPSDWFYRGRGLVRNRCWNDT